MRTIFPGLEPAPFRVSFCFSSSFSLTKSSRRQRLKAQKHSGASRCRSSCRLAYPGAGSRQPQLLFRHGAFVSIRRRTCSRLLALGPSLICRGRHERSQGASSNGRCAADPVPVQGVIGDDDTIEKVAVQGLLLILYKNQITCLLNHNGADRPTLLSMLTGCCRS